MPAIARIGDPITCGDVMAQGSGNVFANGIPVSRFGTDSTAGHCYSPVVMTSAAAGSSVRVNGIPVDVVGDSFPSHSCGSSSHGGSIAVGSPDVNAY